MTILIAEDDNDDFEFFQNAIEETSPGQKVDRVEDGVELIDRLLSGRELPDIVFLDINMPKKNGFQCLTVIRKEESLKDLPVVIFSTTATTEIVNWMYNSGANLYVCKPNDFNLWKSGIDKVLHLDWSVYRPFGNVEQFLLTGF